MAILENAAPKLSLRNPAPQTRRLRRAIRQEHKDGLWLAFRIRAAVVGVVACYGLMTYGFNTRQVFTLANLAALCVIGWVQFRIAGTRYDRPAIMAVFPLADILTLVSTLVIGNEIEGTTPRVMLEEARDFSWFLLLLTLQALAYRPWLATWAGFVTAAAWTALLFWMLSYPGAYGSLTFGPVAPDTDVTQVLLSAFYDPFLLMGQPGCVKPCWRCFAG